jgi:hypothetical protein
MNRFLRLALTALYLASAALLPACGGSGGAQKAPPPAQALPPATFTNVVGSAPADAALGNPLEGKWPLPAGVNIQSVALVARLRAGPSPGTANCVVTPPGSLGADATSATLTIPNTCSAKTVNWVELRLTVRSTDGRSTVARHLFAAPPDPATFLPLRRDLPVLRIATDNLAPIVSKDVYLPAQMTLESPDPAILPVTGGMQIRGRGNSTWGMPKKPYRIKLAEKKSLLGMPSSKDWVLLANYSDKSLLRNAAALELGAKLGLPWTPRAAFVEVYLNDRYDGVYLLAENIKVAKDRVDIDQLATTDVGADKISGGYLLEVDFRQDGHTMYSATDHLPIVFQDPEEPAAEQEAYIKGYIDEFEAVLHSDGFADPDTGYAAYLDVDSFVRWYLVNELFRNVDANMWSSCWMYKPRGGKLHMGPLWDFDLAAGNADYNGAFNTAGWHVHDAPWFSRLFQDPAFAARVRQVWNEMKADQLTAMQQSITANALRLQQSQLNNFQRWPILEMYVWPNYQIPGSYAGEIDYLQGWLAARAAWLDSQFNPQPADSGSTDQSSPRSANDRQLLSPTIR